MWSFRCLPLAKVQNSKYIIYGQLNIFYYIFIFMGCFNKQRLLTLLKKHSFFVPLLICFPICPKADLKYSFIKEEFKCETESRHSENDRSGTELDCDCCCLIRVKTGCFTPTRDLQLCELFGKAWQQTSAQTVAVW